MIPFDSIWFCFILFDSVYSDLFFLDKLILFDSFRISLFRFIPIYSYSDLCKKNKLIPFDGDLFSFILFDSDGISPIMGNFQDFWGTILRIFFIIIGGLYLNLTSYNLYIRCLLRSSFNRVRARDKAETTPDKKRESRRMRFYPASNLFSNILPMDNIIIWIMLRAVICVMLLVAWTMYKDRKVFTCGLVCTLRLLVSVILIAWE